MSVWSYCQSFWRKFSGVCDFASHMSSLLNFWRSEPKNRVFTEQPCAQPSPVIPYRTATPCGVSSPQFHCSIRIFAHRIQVKVNYSFSYWFKHIMDSTIHTSSIFNFFTFDVINQLLINMKNTRLTILIIMSQWFQNLEKWNSVWLGAFDNDCTELFRKQLIPTFRIVMMISIKNHYCFHAISQQGKSS